MSIPSSKCSLNLRAASGKIVHVLVRTFIAQAAQSLVQLVQIVLVLTTGSSTVYDVFGERLRILWSEKLRIVRESNVDQAIDRARKSMFAFEAGRRMERRVLHAISIDFAEIEILADFSNFCRRYAIGGAPDCRRSRRMLCCVSFIRFASFGDAHGPSMSPIKIDRSVSRHVQVPQACLDGPHWRRISIESSFRLSHLSTLPVVESSAWWNSRKGAAAADLPESPNISFNVAGNSQIWLC